MSAPTGEPAVTAGVTAASGGPASGTTAAPYVDAQETHTGVVVLIGDRAYKAKKPVLTDFLDFRTPAQRERACQREVDLNRRLAPDSYLGVAHLTDPAGGPAEPVIVMRRYQNQDRLANRVSRDCDKSVRGMLDVIAAVLARFHDRAQRSALISAHGERGAIDQRWRENLSELKRHASDPNSGISIDSLLRIDRLATEFISGREPLFTRRIEEGCVVDGHGDLLADDIFWVNGEPAVLDCLEFDDKLRYLDRLDDIAFLAMDLEFLGRKDLADYVLDRYTERSGDTAPRSLRDFYIAYRAVVRAKVDCIRLSQGRSEAAHDVARHLDIAIQHLENGSVRLALIGGNPGSGKSTVADSLAKQVGAQVISTDDVRQELRDFGIVAGGAGALNEGLYSPDNINRVYDVAIRRARVLLGHGQSVILDGTWRDPQTRAHANRVAEETHSAIVELMCFAPVDTASDRITTRRPGNSEVTPEIAATLAAQQKSWNTAHRIDTTRPVERSVRDAHEVWRRTV